MSNISSPTELNATLYRPGLTCSSQQYGSPSQASCADAISQLSDVRRFFSIGFRENGRFDQYLPWRILSCKYALSLAFLNVLQGNCDYITKALDN